MMLPALPGWLPRWLPRLAAGTVLVATPLRADEAELSWSGSLATRGQLTLPSTNALLSTADLPTFGGLLEANTQARGRFFDRRLSLLVDASLFVVGGFGYEDVNDDGVLVAIEDHDVVAHRPRLVLSEAILRFDPFEHLSFTVGKQRVVWGSGMAVNPTDVLNPARDPTDPSFQRTGVWLARADIPLRNATFSTIFAPAILLQQSGLPVAMLGFPSYELPGAAPGDDALHWAVAARLYLLVLDSDINLWAVTRNRYGDDIEQRTQLMASFSRMLNDEIEGHTEVLLQQGSARLSVDDDCADGDAGLAGCVLAGRSPLVRDLVDDDRVWPRIVVGGRYMPADESMLSLEYLYASDGLLADDFEDLMRLQQRAGNAQRSGRNFSLQPPGTAADGLPARFAFDVVRRHYLFVSWQKPRIFEDFTLQAGLVTALEDLSSIASGSVVWSAQEWLQLTAFAFLPVPSLARMSSWTKDDAYGQFLDDLDDNHPLRGFLPDAPDIDDTPTGTFDGGPFAFRAVVEARIFF